MDPQVLEERLRDAWALVRSYYAALSAGSATLTDDPQPDLARELFDAWLSDQTSPHMARAMSAAFAMWGNTDRVEEVDRAVAHLDVTAGYWSPAIHAIDRTYKRVGRDSERLATLHRLETTLAHPRSICALAEMLGMEYLYARDPARALRYFSQVVSLGPEGDQAKRALGYLYEIEHLQPGQPAPLIEGVTLDGTRWSLADQLGKVVCVEFWSTDCGFCWPEMPFLREARAAFAGDDFALLGVSKDQDEKRLREVIQQEQLTWPHVWEPGEWRGREYEMGPATKAYNAQGVPRSVLIDRDGRIVALELRREELISAIRTAVERHASPA